jgi:hypothetical protein
VRFGGEAVPVWLRLVRAGRDELLYCKFQIENLQLKIQNAFHCSAIITPLTLPGGTL